jgi:hypothetical protein
LSTEPEPGTQLERRGETLPDVSVAHKAGSIVTEFVSSIVLEAQARGTAIIAEAEEEARARRQSSTEGAARIHQLAESLAGELSDLLGDLRRESESRGGEPAMPTTLPPRMTPSREYEGVADDDAHVVDATVVEDEDGEDTAGGLVLADQNGTAEVAEEPEDPRIRVTRMTDEELARAYSNALRALQRTTEEDEHSARLRALAEATVEEALRRPAFADGEPERRGGLRRRAGARRRRRRALVLSELREACRQARQAEFATGYSAG